MPTRKPERIRRSPRGFDRKRVNMKFRADLWAWLERRAAAKGKTATAELEDIVDAVATKRDPS